MKTIAVVEDNPDNRLLVRVLLQHLYQLADYENGTDAWQALQQSRPNLLLMDISLPDMEGTELLHRLRNHPHLRDLPVIALTAHAMRGDREKFLALGFDDYVSKPIVDESLLLQAIERTLAKQTVTDNP
jgi:two-component system, cell cycle response regulator DivK